jgi:hypothetical protein
MPGRFTSWKRFLRELQHRMRCLPVSLRGGREAEFSEYFSYYGVLGQNLSR